MKKVIAIFGLVAISSTVFASTVDLVEGARVTDRDNNIITCKAQQKPSCYCEYNGLTDVFYLKTSINNKSITLTKPMRSKENCLTELSSRHECI